MKYKAVLSESAFSGVGIVDIIHGINDKVVIQEFYGDETEKQKTFTLYNNNKGTYFNMYGRRYYLSEFIKI